MISDRSGETDADIFGGTEAAEDFAEIPSGSVDDLVESGEAAMARPMALAAPRNGVPDDLQRIRGIGRRIEQRLNALGIYHFGQIAAWTPAEMRWVAQQLAFPDRIDRDDWTGQAIVLAAGGNTGFVKSANRRRTRRQERAFAEVARREAEAAKRAARDNTIAPESGEVGEEDVALGDEGAEGERRTD